MPDAPSPAEAEAAQAAEAAAVEAEAEAEAAEAAAAEAEAAEAAELNQTDVVMIPEDRDSGRHRRANAVTQDNATDAIPAQVDLGPEVPGGRRQRRRSATVPEESAAVPAIPVIIEAEVAEPAGSEPADSEPAVIEAEVAEPADSEPAVTEAEPTAATEAELAEPAVAEATFMTAMATERAIIDAGRHRRQGSAPKAPAPHPASGPEAPRHTRKGRGARAVPGLVDSSVRIPPVTIPASRIRSRQLAMLGILVLLVTIAVVLAIHGSGALSSAQSQPVVTTQSVPS